MAHYKRKNARYKRPYSDWTYPQLERGSKDHTRFANVKRANSVNQNRKEWEKYVIGPIYDYS